MTCLPDTWSVGYNNRLLVDFSLLIHANLTLKKSVFILNIGAVQQTDIGPKLNYGNRVIF